MPEISSMDIDLFEFDAMVLKNWDRLAESTAGRVANICEALGIDVPLERVRFRGGWLEIFVALPNGVEIAMPVPDGRWRMADKN